jgi:hypothetical protein
MWEIMLKSKLTWFAMRAIFIIAAACLVAVKGREWLFNWGNLRIAPAVYFWAAYVFISIVVWLATRNLLRILKAKANAKSRQLFTSASATVDHTDRVWSECVFRYPPRLGYLVAIMAAFWLFGPFLTSNKPIAWWGYCLSLVAGIPTLSYAIYCFRYNVRINKSTIRIRGFIEEHEYALSDIEKMDVQSIKSGRVAVVTLSNGQVVRFSGMLKDFPRLVNRLSEHIKLTA